MFHDPWSAHNLISSSSVATSKMALALQLHSPLLSFTKPPHKSTTTIIITCQTTSSSQTEPDKPVPSSGQGFGPPASRAPKPPPKYKGKGAKRVNDKVIRRAPIAKPESLLGGNDGGDMKKRVSLRGEDAFVVAWVIFGGLILVEGVVLSVSGFLPEEWDEFLVKFLYPIFTPTVFLLVAGTVGYGVVKYLQNENVKNKK